MDNRDDILMAFHEACPVPTVDQIIEWTERHPALADDIRAHAAVSRDWAARGGLTADGPTKIELDRAFNRAINALYGEGNIMSFHFDGHCRSLTGAQDFVNLQHAPDSVKEFLHTAIKYLDEALTDEAKAKIIGVHVKATGHLCDGRGSYEVSNAELVVQPIYASD